MMECRSYTTARPLINAVTISWSPNEIPTVPHCPSGQELFDDFRGPPRDFRVGSLVLTPLGKTNDFKHELGFLVTLVFLNLSSALALTSFFWGFESPNTESSHPNQWFHHRLHPWQTVVAS